MEFNSVIRFKHTSHGPRETVDEDHFESSSVDLTLAIIRGVKFCKTAVSRLRNIVALTTSGVSII